MDNCRYFNQCLCAICINKNIKDCKIHHCDCEEDNHGDDISSNYHITWSERETFYKPVYIKGCEKYKIDWVKKLKYGERYNKHGQWK